MGWFSKKEEKEEKVPSLPELPKLPELPAAKNNSEKLPQLPSLPNNSFGQKFSQNTIKEAVAGEREVNKNMADDFIPQRMPEPPAMKPEIDFPFKEDVERKTKEIPEGFEEAAKKVKSAEPVFIRIDKFEDSLANFERIKEQVSEIEMVLSDIRKTKEEEENELDAWERELKNVRAQIEKIGQNIFSKVK